MTDILFIIKKKPENIFSFLVNISEDDFYKKYWLNHNILHLLALYKQEYLHEVFYSPILKTTINNDILYLSKNFYGYTWFHVLCQYNLSHYDKIKDFIDSNLLNQTDIIGNTPLHIAARFNPNCLKKIIEHKNMSVNVLFKTDILGNTFLHILNNYHPQIFNEIINDFDKKLINIKNYFGKDCFN